MAAYRVVVYRPARRYRYPYRFRSRKNSGSALPVVIATVVLAAGAGAGVKTVVRHHAPTSAHTAPTGNAAAARVIAFARTQLGKPYLWGGTGPGAFDCSGLAMEAYASAGIAIARTSQQQWATLPHVPASQVRPGDLVFFPGSDGTWLAPGHVAIVISATKIIQAYGIGTPIEISLLNAAGAGVIVGFARPPAPGSPVTAAAAPGSGEAGFIAALLSALGAPGTEANKTSLAAWIRHEWPTWPPKAQDNPLDTTQAEPGSWNFNTFGEGLHVQSYPSAAEGVHATVATLLGGYPLIVSALRSGAGLHGNPALAGEFGKWSGNGYQGV